MSRGTVQFPECGAAFGGGRFQACFCLRADAAGFFMDCGATSLVAIQRFAVDAEWAEDDKTYTV